MDIQSILTIVLQVINVIVAVFNLVKLFGVG